MMDNARRVKSGARRPKPTGGWFIGILLVLLAGLISCASLNTNGEECILAQISSNMDQAVEVLARDWPKASGAIRGGVGEGNLPQNIVTQMNEIDKWFQTTEGEWLSPDEYKLSDYKKYYAAFARLSHSGPVLRVIIEQYAPGLLMIPEVMTVLTFAGLGGL